MNVAYRVYQYDKRHRLKCPPTAYTQSKSFVKAFLQFVYISTSSLTQSVIDIDNVSRSVVSNAASFGVIHPGLSSRDDFLTVHESYKGPYDVFADEKGIVVGTSSTAVAVADDNLVAIIPNGTSAGQFVYYGCWGLNYTTGASSASFDIERIFRNSSGGSIVVAEIGMYCASTTGQSSPPPAVAFGFCILRDVLGATVTVLDGEYLKVKYTITVSN